MLITQFIEWIDECDAVEIQYDNSKGSYLEYVSKLSPELQIGVNPLVTIESKEEGFSIVINCEDIEHFDLQDNNVIYDKVRGLSLSRFKRMR